ncbi:TFIIE alpha subunit-domain-containing protein [Dipodascopsis tothii]|uniref:TFIIE alpha subunit-domain-containing protein n=1 Tax=Dipodascopsis tothii TaxID=44089 RepID=UPI0034CEA651
MDHVKVLIQYVVRSFYDTRHVIILDAILRHSAISDDDLAQMVGVQKKELHKICAKLREDRLLKVYARSESKEGQQRPTQKTYYYIQYREAVDAVKWRVHKLGETFNNKMRTDVDTQRYMCGMCGRKYSTIEVLPLQAPDLSGFICADCGSTLQDDNESDEMKVGQERLARLMSQIRRLIDTLKKIDDTFIPDNDFDTSLKTAVPTSIDGSDTGYSTIAYAKKGPNTASMSLQVDITSGSENSEAAAAAAAAAAAKLEQNQLPIWHLQSTIGGDKPGSALDATTIKAEDSALARASAPPASHQENVPVLKMPDEDLAEDDIAAYYNSLTMHAAADEEEEDDDDDDDEFEDVVVGDTPAPAAKRSASASDDEPGAKRARDDSASQPADDDDDDDDEDEFQDI